jgi:hypothetical protein
MNWKDQVGACFGCVDQIFALHPNDEERAKKMINDALAAGNSIEEVLAAASEHLESKKCPQNHIEEQLGRVRNVASGIYRGSRRH